MRNQLYRLVIHKATDHCYENCLGYFRNNASVLDVGIGNGQMMRTYHPLIKSKGLKIIGLDINKSYLNHCDGLIQNHGLKDNIQICHQPVESYEPRKGYYFDFVLFSMSFMLLADQKCVLDRVKEWLKPDGRIIFFQTIFKYRFKLMEIIKPRLKYLTTIDFGNVTYEKILFELLAEKNLSVLEDRSIKQTWFGGEYRMIVTCLAGRNTEP